ncbi:hypothetical protein B0H14DRAFT_3444007 [Mycena olivaceomarginata]|nr:hypothetical protein B0H14DRAFT_3444007 [Mycena olivaceomarginata]
MTAVPSDPDLSSLPSSTAPTPASLYLVEPSTRPTIVLPALRDRQAAASTDWSHLRSMAERARAAVATAPLPPSADATEDTTGMVIDPCPDDSAGLALPDAPMGTLPLTAQSSQTDSDLTELTDPGDNPPTTADTSGFFHVDTCFAGAAEGSAASAVPAYPTAAPSPLNRRTDPPKFFHDTNMVLYNHIGLAPPLAGETAGHQRERMTQNEVKLVAYVTSLERTASAIRTDTSARNAEFARMLADTQATLRSTGVGHNAGNDVAPLKLELAMVLSDLGANDSILPEVVALKAELTELRTDMLAADNQRICASSPFSSERDAAYQALIREVAALRSCVTTSSTSQPLALETDNTFLALCAAVQEDKQRMEDIVNALPPPEFYDAITTMRADISSLYSKAAEAGRITTAMAPSSASAVHGPTRPLAAAVPSLFMPAPPAPPPLVARLPTIAPVPSNIYMPAVTGNTGPTTSAPPHMFHTSAPLAPNAFASSVATQHFIMPTALEPPTAAATKCSASTSGGSAGKHQRLDNFQNPWPDVLFGPVTISASTKQALNALTISAIYYLVQLAANAGQHCTIGSEDIASTQVDHSSPNTLSIRFKSRDKGTLFCALVDRYSPLPGQTAVFRGDSVLQHGRVLGVNSSAPSSNQQALQDLFGGSTSAVAESLVATYSDLRIISWNIGGDLPIKIREKSTIKLINSNNVVFLQETWLRPEQEHSLPLPPGFILVARSRGNGGSMRRCRGGVAAIIRATLRFKVLEGISGPDLIALELENIFLVGTYIAPSTNHSWGTWSDVHLSVRFNEALAWCSSQRFKCLAALGDLNGRVRDESPPSSSLPCHSADRVLNARGRWIVDACEDNRLEILNGTRYEASSPGAFTSHQPGGEGMVDYTLFSGDFLSWLKEGDLQILPVPREWSDHSILALHITFPAPTPRPVPQRTIRLRELSPPPTPTVCDVLVEDTLATTQTNEESTMALYGTVPDTARRRVHVVVASVCVNYARPDVAAAFTLDSHAVLHAILFALTMANPSRVIDISTTSKYAVRSICYLAGGNHTRGWTCANGDLLDLIARAIQARSAQTVFTFIDVPRESSTYTEARAIATTTGLDPEREVGQYPGSGTALEKCDPHVPRARTTVTVAQLALADKPDAHRNRVVVRRAQAENLNRLLNAENIREWWEVIRDLTDAKR